MPDFSATQPINASADQLGRAALAPAGSMSAFAYGCGLSLLRAYRVLFPVQPVIQGLHNLPAGPKILAGNHPNASDILLLVPQLPQRVTLVAQGSFFHLPLLGWILRESGQIPVQPEDRRAAYVEGCRALRRGETVLIFPEGRLNPDGLPLRAGTGAVRMSLETGAPIVPLGISVERRDVVCLVRNARDGTHTGRWQLRGRFGVNIGTPWLPGAALVEQNTSAGAHELTVQLMDRIFALARQTL